MKPPASDSDLPTTRELSKLVTFFLKNIRPQSKQEQLGVFRNILAMLKRGKVTASDISVALQNYANDDFVKSCDPRQRHNIRTFFTEDKILQWKTPIKKRTLDPSIEALERLAEARAASVEIPISTISEDDEEELDEL